MQRPRQPRVSPVPQGPRVPTVRVSPDGSRDAVRQKVEKLQQALAVMEDTGGVAVECLKAELEKAKKASQKPPLNVKVDECRKFIARSEKRLADAMREERDQAVQNPAVKRQAVGHVPPRNNGVIPPMPTLVPAELDNWMQDLQQEFQNAMTIGDQRRVVEVSTELAEGASQMVYLMGGVAK